MVLVFNHNALITVDGNVSVSIEPVASLPQNIVDMAVIGVGNFVSGNYIQKSSDVNDIVSNFTLSTTGIRNAGFYVAHIGATSDINSVGLSAYGVYVESTGDNLQITGRKTYDNYNTGKDRKWFGNLQLMNGNRSNIANSTKLFKGKGGTGPVLVQAAAAALFKQFGKNAAIANDKVISSRQVKLGNDLSNAFTENNLSYDDSVIFKRYLSSGRYADDGADVNTVINYNLENTAFDFIVQLSGNVSDKDNEVFAPADITKILGSKDLEFTKVAPNGSYKFNIFMRLEHHSEINNFLIIFNCFLSLILFIIIY